jgi:5-formyltetrahydrofolate cyclo-ligase
MAGTLANPKAELRQKIHAVLQNISAAVRLAASAQACRRLREQPFWQEAASVLFFAPLADELDLWPLQEEALAAGKVAALPRFDPASNDYLACRVQNAQNEVGPGHFGIREPKAGCPEISLERLGLILVPGVAFDLTGHRLGRGRGFYDRLLAEIHSTKCGVAFDEQIVDAVPAGKLDVRMDFILTPTRCVRCEM